MPIHLYHPPPPVEPVDRDRRSDQRQHDRRPQQERPDRRQLRLALQRQPFVPPVDELEAHPLLGSRVRGSSGLRPSLISKCTCGSSTEPVWPARAMTSPLFTICPRPTSSASACA